MQLRRIKILALVAPAVGLGLFEIFRHFVLQPFFGETSPHLSEHIASGAFIVVAVIAFSLVVFRLLERAHGQLVAVSEAALAITSNLSLDRVLERVAELARTVAAAEYASVRIGGEHGRTVSSGARPTGGPTLRLPIVVRDETLGELMLARASGKRFPKRSRRALETFATQAGIALENARLFEQVHELVAARERTRIGMDLHDGVIQELYALGLKVEDAEELTAANPSEAAAAMRDVHSVLRHVIGEIRTYIYGLRDGDGSVDLRPALEHLVAEFPAGGPALKLELAGETRLPGALAGNVLHIVREALANAIRHAEPSRIVVRSLQGDEGVTVAVTDDGKGFDPASSSTGLGIGDMRERATWCGCGLEVRSRPGEGTEIRLSVPATAAKAS